MGLFGFSKQCEHFTLEKCSPQPSSVQSVPTLKPGTLHLQTQSPRSVFSQSKDKQFVSRRRSSIAHGLQRSPVLNVRVGRQGQLDSSRSWKCSCLFRGSLASSCTTNIPRMEPAQPEQFHPSKPLSLIQLLLLWFCVRLERGEEGSGKGINIYACIYLFNKYLAALQWAGHGSKD